MSIQPALSMGITAILPAPAIRLHVGGTEGQLDGFRVLPHALLEYLVDALQDPLDHFGSFKQVVADVLAHLGRIDDSFPGVAPEDFFDADSVDDGVDLAFLEVFQVQLAVGVDDDGVAGGDGPGLRHRWIQLSVLPACIRRPHPRRRRKETA